MQYTVWPIAGLYLMNVWTATVYSLAGGLLLAKVYSRWSHAHPWKWYQAWANGMDREERRYAALVWLVLLIVIVVNLVPAFRRPPPSDADGPHDGPDDTVSKTVRAPVSAH